MTYFSFEVPIPHLDTFDKHQDFILVLVHLVKYQRYTEYLQHKKEQGKFIVLDNSFNETQEPTPVLVMAMAYHLLRPDLVVCPDSDDWGVIETVQAFTQLKEEVPPEDILCLYKTKEEYEALKSEGCKIFGTSYWWRDKLEMEIPKEHFRFGLLALDELKEGPNFLDTSMPVKLALKGLTWTQWIDEGCPHFHTKDMPNFFETKLTQSQLNLAVDNIAKLKEIANG